MKKCEQSMWLEYEADTPPQSVVRGYEAQENECVATLLCGIPDEGGSAPKRTFEMLIRMAFQGGLVAIQSDAREGMVSREDLEKAKIEGLREAARIVSKRRTQGYECLEYFITQEANRLESLLSEKEDK